MKELFKGEKKLDQLILKLENNPSISYYQGVHAALDGEHTLSEIKNAPNNFYKLGVTHVLTNQFPDNLNFLK